MTTKPKAPKAVRDYMRFVGKLGVQSRLSQLTPEQRREFALSGVKAKQDNRNKAALVGTDAANTEP